PVPLSCRQSGLFLLGAFVRGGSFGFVFRVDAAGDGFARSEPDTLHLAVFFQLLFRRRRETRPRDGFEALAFDGFAGEFANAVIALANAHHRFINFIHGILLRGGAAQSQVAVETIRSRVGHVEAESGLFLARVLDQITLAAEQVIADFPELLVLLPPFGGHPVMVGLGIGPDHVGRRGTLPANTLLGSFHCHGNKLAQSLLKSNVRPEIEMGTVPRLTRAMFIVVTEEVPTYGLARSGDLPLSESDICRGIALAK